MQSNLDVAEPLEIDSPSTPALLVLDKTGMGSQHPKSDYLFVSNVRFLAMFSIIWIHTAYFLGSAPSKSPAAYFQELTAQAMKFGTIGFFLISGFLLGEGVTRTGRLKYFYRRVKAVFVPWLWWGGIWFVIAVFNHLQGSGAKSSMESSFQSITQEYFKFVFTKSIYWFVPNFFICLAIVLSLYGRVPDLVQGTIFLALSLFYGANTYLGIISSRHTGALFGFVFFLWLGSYAYRHCEALNRWLHRTSWTRLIAYTTVAAALALVEFHLLSNGSSADPNNSLRISNQAFSVLMTLLIAKARRTLLPSWIEVRTETFGLFLIHPILLELYYWGRQSIPEPVPAGISQHGFLLIVLGVSFFLSIYLASLLITKQIRRVNQLRWMVGR